MPSSISYFSDWPPEGQDRGRSNTPPKKKELNRAGEAGGEEKLVAEDRTLISMHIGNPQY